MTPPCGFDLQDTRFHMLLVMVWLPRKEMVMQGALPTVVTWLLHGTSSSDFLKITPYPVHDP